MAVYQIHANWHNFGLNYSGLVAFTLINSNNGNRFYLHAPGNGDMRFSDFINFLWDSAGNGKSNSEKAFTKIGSHEL